MSDNKGFRYYAILVGALFVGSITGNLIRNATNPTKTYKSTSEVQSGYVVPSKLEIKLRDSDGNGQDEVLMNYDGKSYLLRVDEAGKPYVQAYEVKPAEVIPGK